MDMVLEYQVNRGVQGHCECDQSNGTNKFWNVVCWVLGLGSKLLRSGHNKVSAVCELFLASLL